MKRWLAAPLVLGAGLAAAALPAGSALADTTIGQTGTQPGGTNSFTWFGGGWEYVNPAAVVPGAGLITSFHTQAATSGYCQTIEGLRPAHPGAGVYDFQVLRPEAGGQYLVVGATGDQTDPCDGQVHSYSVSIPVQAGDVLGVYVYNDWAGALTGGQYAGVNPGAEPAVGQSFTVSGTHSGISLDESATLVTAADLLARLGSAAKQAGGPGSSLPGKVQQAQSSLQAGDVTGTCSTLTGFINEVTAQAGKKIPVATAGQLITSAGQVKTVLGCS